ncbi:hypothetical protein Tco_1109403 [Tanacetum coccineum]
MVEILKPNLELIAIVMLDLRPIEMIQNLRHETFSLFGYGRRTSWTGRKDKKAPQAKSISAMSVTEAGFALLFCMDVCLD